MITKEDGKLYIGMTKMIHAIQYHLQQQNIKIIKTSEMHKSRGLKPQLFFFKLIQIKLPVAD